eukprot:scaffold314557_cov36-Tisochrysis_lutea.AAC.1
MGAMTDRGYGPKMFVLMRPVDASVSTLGKGPLMGSGSGVDVYWGPQTRRGSHSTGACHHRCQVGEDTRHRPKGPPARGRKRRWVRTGA